MKRVFMDMKYQLMMMPLILFTSLYLLSCEDGNKYIDSHKMRDYIILSEFINEQCKSSFVHGFDNLNENKINQILEGYDLSFVNANSNPQKKCLNILIPSCNANFCFSIATHYSSPKNGFGVLYIFENTSNITLIKKQYLWEL